MTRRVLVALAWTVVAFDVLAVILVLVGLLPEPPSSPPGGSLIFVFLTASYGIVGARVVTRDVRNSVGWILWVQPTLIALSGAGVAYAQISVQRYGASLPGTALLGWAGSSSLVLFILLTALVIPMLFPNGRLRSRRWRPVAALVTLATTLTMTGMMFVDQPVLPGLPNPFGIPGAEAVLELASQVGAASTLLSLPLVVASVVVRFRRGSGVEREQVKWFAIGFLVPAILLLAALALQAVELLWVGAVASLGAIPITIGIAILRYHLYEIDRIISRTIGWALVTGMLVVVFAAFVVTLQAVLAPVTKENTLAVAASTLIAFALFQPLRRRVQRAVDRRFDRARYDGERIVAAFAGRLRDQVDLGSLEEEMARVAHEAVRPSGTAVWLRNARGDNSARVP
jgi:hypothetical protein